MNGLTEAINSSTWGLVLIASGIFGLAMFFVGLSMVAGRQRHGKIYAVIGIGIAQLMFSLGVLVLSRETA